MMCSFHHATTPNTHTLNRLLLHSHTHWWLVEFGTEGLRPQAVYGCLLAVHARMLNLGRHPWDERPVTSASATATWAHCVVPFLASTIINGP